MIQMRHEYLESIDSTNNEIKRRAVAGETEGFVISAGKQTAGRGRSGHQWETPADISINHIAFAATDGSHRPPQQSYSGGCSGGATRH